MKKGKGWYKDSYRHGLAAKGIKTKNLENVTNTEYKKLFPKSHWNLDSDNDGVINKDDCYPFDPERQHLRGRHKRQVKKALRTSGKPQRDEMIHTFREYPWLADDLKDVSEEHDDFELEFRPGIIKSDPNYGGVSEGGKITVKQIEDPLAEDYPKIIAHELKHEKQSLEGADEKYNRFMYNYVEKRIKDVREPNVYKRQRILDKILRDAHEENPYEKEAYAYAKQKVDPYIDHRREKFRERRHRLEGYEPDRHYDKFFKSIDKETK